MTSPDLANLHQLRDLLLAEHDLAFVIGNPAGGGESVIYVTDDPNLGKLDLTIANNSNSPIEIGSESVLQIYVSPPLAEADLPRIKLATPDWTLTRDEDSLVLRCTSRATIAPNGKLTIRFADVMASGQPGTGFFQFEYSHFAGIADGDRRSPQIFILRPPKSQPAPLLALLAARPEYAGQHGGTVYVTPWNPTPPDKGIENHFIVQIANQQADKAIPPDANLDSKVVISFISGNSALSVCRDDQIKVAVCSMAQNPSSGPWDISKDNSGPVPVWTMRPPRGANVFDAGGLVAFRFDGIVSQLPPDLGARMFIQFANLPGYNDGYTGFVLQKVPPVPYIAPFDAYSGARKLAPGAVVGFKEKITLAWNAFAAERVRITELNQAFPPTQQSVDVFPSERANPYTLVPQIGTDSRNELRKELSLNVSTPVAKLEATLEPVDATINLVKGWDSQLHWNCSNGSHCQLTGAGEPRDRLPLSGTCPVDVNDAATFTIACIGAGSSSASVTVKIPPPEFKLTVDARDKKLLIVTWSAKWAKSTRVWVLSTQLGWSNKGSVTLHYELPSSGARVSIGASGNGQVSREVKVTPQNRYIEVHVP